MFLFLIRCKGILIVGFVRFKRREEAMRAIKSLDGIKIGGKILKVSLAQYDRNGKAWDCLR